MCATGLSKINFRIFIQNFWLSSTSKRDERESKGYAVALSLFQGE